MVLGWLAHTWFWWVFVVGSTLLLKQAGRRTRRQEEAAAANAMAVGTELWADVGWQVRHTVGTAEAICYQSNGSRLMFDFYQSGVDIRTLGDPGLAHIRWAERPVLERSRRYRWYRRRILDTLLRLDSATVICALREQLMALIGDQAEEYVIRLLDRTDLAPDEFGGAVKGGECLTLALLSPDRRQIYCTFTVERASLRTEVDSRVKVAGRPFTHRRWDCSAAVQRELSGCDLNALVNVLQQLIDADAALPRDNL